MKYKNYLAKISRNEIEKIDSKEDYINQIHDEMQEIYFITKKVTGKKLTSLECLEVLIEEKTYNKALHTTRTGFVETDTNLHISTREILNAYIDKKLQRAEYIFNRSVVLITLFIIFVYFLFT